MNNKTAILGARVYLTSSCTQYQKPYFEEGQESDNLMVVFTEQMSDAVTGYLTTVFFTLLS